MDTLAAAKLITREPRYQRLVADWQALWDLEEAPLARWLLSTAPALLPIYTGRYPLTKYFYSKEMQLQAELETLAWRDMLDIDDMFVPHVQPYGGVTVFASAFGCEVEFSEHTQPWAHPVIEGDDPAEKVYDLPRPSVTDGQLGQMLKINDYLVQQTGGRYPVAITDMQGPMDTAYLIWDSTAFMMGMYDHPKEVHHLMRLVTDLIIDFVKEQRAGAPEFCACHYPPLWLPDGMGIAISEDVLAVLSPRTYEEFALPYVNELSEEFGGVYIHSCGNFAHQFKVLERVHNLRGLNFGASETPFEPVWDRFNGKTVIAPHLGLNKEIPFKSRLDYIEHILRVKTHNRGLIIVVSILEPGQNRPEVDPVSVKAFAGEVSRLLARYP